MVIHACGSAPRRSSILQDSLLPPITRESALRVVFLTGRSRHLYNIPTSFTHVEDPFILHCIRSGIIPMILHHSVKERRHPLEPWVLLPASLPDRERSYRGAPTASSIGILRVSISPASASSPGPRYARYSSRTDPISQNPNRSGRGTRAHPHPGPCTAREGLPPRGRDHRWQG